jgi:hypothetical protein
MDHHALLADAQFYLGELQSRKERRSRRIDIFLELVIIGMIGWEIHDGNKQASALRDVAENAGTTASVLQTVQSTMEAMNKTIQAQNAEANRVLFDLNYSGDWLYLTNTGHPAIFIYSIHTGNLPVTPLTPTPNVSTGNRVQLPTPGVEQDFSATLKKQKRYVMPIALYLTDGAGKQYVARTSLVGEPVGSAGGITIKTRNVTISEENWKKEKP